jgi:hypothetical protein
MISIREGFGSELNETGIMRRIRQITAILWDSSSVLCIAGTLICGGCGRGDSTSHASLNSPQDGRAAERGPVQEVDGTLVERLGAERAKAVVLIFTRTDCPIANRYAPEIRRLHAKFAGQGVDFHLVYPETTDSPAAIREHLAAFHFPLEAWRDPAHILVRRFGAKVTPEVAVFIPDNKLTVYRGRIDDLYVDLGQARRAPTTHDLEEVLTAVLSDRPVSTTTTTAVGCTIGDLP